MTEGEAGKAAGTSGGGADEIAPGPNGGGLIPRGGKSAGVSVSRAARAGTTGRGKISMLLSKRKGLGVATRVSVASRSGARALRSFGTMQSRLPLDVQGVACTWLCESVSGQVWRTAERFATLAGRDGRPAKPTRSTRRTRLKSPSQLSDSTPGPPSSRRTIKLAEPPPLPVP